MSYDTVATQVPVFWVATVRNRLLCSNVREYVLSGCLAGSDAQSVQKDRGQGCIKQEMVCDLNQGKQQR